MKIIRAFLALYLIVCVSSSVVSMDVEKFNFRCAREDDAAGILALQAQSVGTVDVQDVVILPEEVRAGAVQGAVKAGKVFVAESNGEVVGMKKFFALQGEECLETLRDEIRCIGDNFDYLKPNLQRTVSFNDNELIEQAEVGTLSLLASDFYFYNGGDLTAQDHRGKGLNSALTKHTLHNCARPVIEGLPEGSLVHMVYGLTHGNQGGLEERVENIFAGRSKRIAKTVAQFMCKVLRKDSIAFGMARYTSEKPEFKFDQDEGTLGVVMTGKTNGDGFVLSFEVPAQTEGSDS